MADDKLKIATCDICGAQESAEDADALEEALAMHMRDAHNLSRPKQSLAQDVQNTGVDVTDNEVTYVPVPPQAPITGASSNIPGTGPDLGGAERY